MPLLRSLIDGLRVLFRKQRAEHEMNEELRGYMDAAVNEKMRSGMSPEDALRAARVEMGSTDAVKEGIRSAGWGASVESVWQDVRYGLRQLKRSPGFAIVAILTLALGIGANTAIFSLIDAVVLRMLPVSRPGELRLLRNYDPHEGGKPGAWCSLRVAISRTLIRRPRPLWRSSIKPSLAAFSGA
jgi:hypothetical protein